MTNQRNCYICGCVRNTGKYIDKIFANIKQIGNCFDSFIIIVSYDTSEDNSYEMLEKYQKVYSNMRLLYNKDKVLSVHRTERIATARNEILDEINNMNNNDYNYMIMMDFDDVCSTYSIDTNVILNTLDRDDWDSISFNRKPYYDTWALSIDVHVYSMLSFEEDMHLKLQEYITEKISKLKPDELLPCYSAFNGLAIYRMDKFVNCRYEWDIHTSSILIEYLLGNKVLEANINAYNKKFIIDKEIEDCEHRSFHLLGIIKNNARIRISKKNVFKIPIHKQLITHIFNSPNSKYIQLVLILLIVITLATIFFCKYY